MLDIKFKKIELEDKSFIQFYLDKNSSCLSAFTFSSIISWVDFYNYEWAIFDNTLLIKFIELEDGKEYLFQPIGDFPLSLQEKIIKYSRTLDYKMKIYGVSEDFIYKYSNFISYFEIEKRRDMDNYIYLSEDLANLKGGNYQPKRNLIRQFEDSNNWKSEPVTPDNIHSCFEVIEKIYNKEELSEDVYLGYEIKALRFVLNNFSKLDQNGVLVSIDGEPVAFSIYEKLNDLTCVVHFEKAMREFKGIYQIINRETAKIIFSKGYKYINREEDLGIDGLRKAKLSYHPVKFCLSDLLVFKK